MFPCVDGTRPPWKNVGETHMSLAACPYHPSSLKWIVDFQDAPILVPVYGWFKERFAKHPPETGKSILSWMEVSWTGGYPQIIHFSVIYRWIFHEINHPAIGTHDYGTLPFLDVPQQTHEFGGFWHWDQRFRGARRDSWRGVEAQMPTLADIGKIRSGFQTWGTLW